MSNEVSENLIENERRELWNAVFIESLHPVEIGGGEPKGELRKVARYSAMIADVALEQFDKRFVDAPE